MFIKKARIYKLVQPTEITPEALETFKFNEITANESVKFGFYPALGQNLIHEAGGHRLIVIRKDSKILPASVVKAEVKKRADARAFELGRPISRKERQVITEDVEAELLPRAFVNQKYTQAIFSKAGYVFVNGSASEAENLFALLRKALNSLPLVPFSSITKERPDYELNEFVKQTKQSETFQLGSVFEFQGADDVTLKFKGLGVMSDEVQGATEYGLTTKAEISSRHGICFTLNDDCAMSSIQWSEQLESRAEGDDAAAVFDSQFFIAAETFEGVANDMLEMFGGYAVVN